MSRNAGWALVGAVILGVVAFAVWGGPRADVALGQRPVSFPSQPTPGVPDESTGGDSPPATRVPPPATATATAIGTVPFSRPAESDGSSVEVLVVDTDSRPVAGVTLCLVEERGRERRGSMVTGANGDARLGGVRKGAYLLTVLPKSLPAGLLAPWRQDEPRAISTAPRTGFYSTAVCVSGDADALRATIVLLHEATVDGYAVGPDGAAIANAHVRIQSSVPGFEGLGQEVNSDAQGKFHFAGVYASRYRAYLRIPVGPTTNELSAPLPVDFEIAAGEHRVLPNLQAGGGSNEIVGRVVDQDSVGMPGLEVICCLVRPVGAGDRGHDWGSTLARTTTDATGRFALRHLPAEVLRVTIAPEGFLPGRELAANRLVWWIPQDEVDFRTGAPSRDLGVRHADESRPFTLHGRVEADKTWLATRGLTLEDVAIDLAVDDHATPFVEGPGRKRFETAVVRVDRSTGTFEWKCETPQPAISAVAVVRGKKIEATRVAVTPAPRGTQDVVIRLPG